MTHAERGDDLSPSEIGEYATNSVLKGIREGVDCGYFLFISAEKPDGSADVCHVGNGPTSPSNAKFIEAARADVPALVAEVEQLRAALLRLQSSDRAKQEAFTENEIKDVLCALYQDGHVDLVLADRIAALMKQQDQALRDIWGIVGNEEDVTCPADVVEMVADALKQSTAHVSDRAVKEPDLKHFIEDLDCGSYSERHQLDADTGFKIAEELKQRLAAEGLVSSPQEQLIADWRKAARESQAGVSEAFIACADDLAEVSSPARPQLEHYEETKRCCSVCDAKKLCHVCGNPTLLACSDCRIDFGVTVYVCREPACRDEHEHKCRFQMRRLAEGAASAPTPALEQARDALQRARQFIVNGVEFGYIQMPTMSGDAALDTLPAIELALARLQENMARKRGDA